MSLKITREERKEAEELLYEILEMVHASYYHNIGINNAINRIAERFHKYDHDKAVRAKELRLVREANKRRKKTIKEQG